jgi:hypothetical protein
MNNGGWKPSVSRDFYLNEWTNPKDLHRNYSLFIFHYSFAVCRSQTDKLQFEDLPSAPRANTKAPPVREGLL